MKRSILGAVQRALEKKIVLVTGPRQCGKTTLSKMITSSFDYFNLDYPEKRVDLQKKTWDLSKEMNH